MTSSTSSGWRSEKNAPIEYSSVSMRDSRNESRPAGGSSSSKGAGAYSYGTLGSDEVVLDVALVAADVAPEMSGADGAFTATWGGVGAEGGSGALGGAGALGADGVWGTCGVWTSTLGASAFGALGASGAFADGTSADGRLGPPAPAAALVSRPASVPPRASAELPPAPS